MSAVILCDLPADAAIKTLILDRVVLLAIEGSGELLFVGRRDGDHVVEREIIAVRLRESERAHAIVEAWRCDIVFPPSSELTLLRVAPMRPTDNPSMLFP